jgi:hypothetical protein
MDNINMLVARGVRNASSLYEVKAQPTPTKPHVTKLYHRGATFALVYTPWADPTMKDRYLGTSNGVEENGSGGWFVGHRIRVGKETREHESNAYATFEEALAKLVELFESDETN